MFFLRIIILLLLFFKSLVGVAALPPKHLNNLCKVFSERPQWYWAAKKVAHRWGIPISIQMAIVFEESRFISSAEPPRHKLFGKIPWLRPTTASGYAQALTDTWRRYLKAVGRISANRGDMDDALDFMGWYLNDVHRELHIPKSDAFSLYLAYHEGIGGYRRKTFRGNSKLMHIAHFVASRSAIYRQQLQRCQARLPNKPIWEFW